LKLSPDILLNTASKNRIALAFLTAIKNTSELESRYWQQSWNDYWQFAQDTLEKRKASLEALPELLPGMNYSLVKNDMKNVDISSDIDVLFSGKDDYQKAVEILKQKGSVVVQTDRKSDGYIEGMIPVDLHLGLTFGSFQYFSNDILDSASPNLSSVVVIAHAAAELTIVTLGDIAKIGTVLHDQAFQNELEHIARTHGWWRSCKSWLLRAQHPKCYGYDIPLFLPVTPLVLSRFGLYIQNPFRVDGLTKELFLLALSVRARMKGFVPFHDEWIKKID
jgi:hypothetical protein